MKNEKKKPTGVAKYKLYRYYMRWYRLISHVYSTHSLWSTRMRDCFWHTFAKRISAIDLSLLCNTTILFWSKLITDGRMNAGIRHSAISTVHSCRFSHFTLSKSALHCCITVKHIDSFRLRASQHTVNVIYSIHIDRVRTNKVAI